MHNTTKCTQNCTLFTRIYTSDENLGVLICIRRVIRRQPTLSHVTSDEYILKVHTQYTLPSSHFALIIVQMMMMTRQQLYILIKPRSNLIKPDQTWSNLIKPDQTWSNLIKPRRITTSRQNSASTPPIAEVIPFYSRQRNVYPPLGLRQIAGPFVHDNNHLISEKLPFQGEILSIVLVQFLFLCKTLRKYILHNTCVTFTQNSVLRIFTRKRLVLTEWVVVKQFSVSIQLCFSDYSSVCFFIYKLFIWFPINLSLNVLVLSKMC
jgi:hypothetical protein